MFTIDSNQLRATPHQTTVFAGPHYEIGLTACACEIMNSVGLVSLSDTNKAFKSDPGQEVQVVAHPESHELQITDVTPDTSGWVVIEQLANGEPRGRLYQTQVGAAAQFGAKLVLQEAGAITVERDSNTGFKTIHFAGSGPSQISAITMTCLAA